MTYSVLHNVEEGIIEAWFKGDLNIKTARDFMREIIDRIAQEKCFLLLTDMSEASFVLSVVDIFSLLKFMEELGSRLKLNLRVIRRAVITKQPDALAFYETVFYNRGYQMAIFNDPAKARTWLHEGKRMNHKVQGNAAPYAAHPDTSQAD